MAHKYSTSSLGFVDVFSMSKTMSVPWNSERPKMGPPVAKSEGGMNESINPIPLPLAFSYPSILNSISIVKSSDSRGCWFQIIP